MYHSSELYDIRGLRKAKCEECKKKLRKEDNPKRYTICKKCREKLFRTIDIMNGRSW